MPVKQTRLGGLKRTDARLESLKKQLIAEWQHPESGNLYPDIREEVDGAGRIVHVYVIWDAWPDLDQQRRSELITDAFVAVRGESAVLDLTVAMGLTPEEARRMGIE